MVASQIAELVAPSRVLSLRTEPKEWRWHFRRSRIVPVCEVSEKLIGKSPDSAFLPHRRNGEKSEWVALPVTGECELIATEMSPATEADAPYVAGWISHDGNVIEVLNIDALTPGPISAPAVCVPLEMQEATT
jgi:hypothetical protein